MGKCEFNNSTLKGLVGDIITYSKQNINNTIIEGDVVSEDYNYYYTSENLERLITDACYNYSSGGKLYVADENVGLRDRGKIFCNE